MPWQRAGTVSVQANSTTVTGVNVDFAANSRTGDSFIGPDGFSYEVTNVASATVISILPPYKGPTASGAAYAIMPVQGYDKMLSDAFNNLNNQFGPKLAALGTTGNYDILPVSKGGTGAATAQDARSSFGLGTAATVNIQTSITDESANVLMRNGAWSWGAVLGNRALDLNALNVSQAVALNSTANTPFSHGSTTIRFADGSMALALNWAAAHQQQLVFSRATSQIALRRKNANVWQPDDYLCIYPTGQTFLSVSQGGTGGNTQVAARTGLGLGSAAVASLVGPVSQAGGVPTGAVMQYGSNANGSFIRFADGTQICWQKASTGIAITGGPANGLYYGTANWTFPAQFFAEPVATCSAQSDGVITMDLGGPSTTSQFSLGIGALTSIPSRSFGLSLFAIGRWYA